MVFSANLENVLRYTHLRWETIFAEKSHRLLDAVLDYADIDAGLMNLFEVYQSQALGPNVNQRRLMDRWRAQPITNGVKSMVIRLFLWS